MSTDSQQQPSLSLEAEQAVLGTLMESPDLISDVSNVLSGKDFYRGFHTDIFDAISRLAEEGDPTDFTAVTVELQRFNLLERLPSGPGYLGELLARSVPAHVHFYAQVVREAAIRRNLQAFHTNGLQRINDGSGDNLETLLAGAQSGLDEVASERSTSDVIRVDDSLTSTLDYMEELSKRSGNITGVPTGFADLDEKTSGLHPGQMIVIAARPAVGKSTLGLDFARNAAIKHGLPTLMFSLEMSHSEITMRLLSAEARVPLQNVRSGKLAPEEWDRISRKLGPIMEAPLFIDDTPSITMGEIKTKARRIKQRHGLSMVIIDFLQLMTSELRSNSRQEEVSQMSRAAKLMAKELECPVVIMSQLNRGSEQRADKRPAIADLRESGAIEQDADIIILLYREDVTDPDSARPGEADLILGKQRNGPTGICTVAFQGHYSRFVDMARDT